MKSFNMLVGVAEETTWPGHVVALVETLKASAMNPVFVKDGKKWEKANEILTLVDPEVRVRAQLETNAYKTLRAKAAKVAEDTGTYTAPTLTEITAYIEAGVNVWRDKQ